jgi:hypothetical protein
MRQAKPGARKKRKESSGKKGTPCGSPPPFTALPSPSRQQAAMMAGAEGCRDAILSTHARTTALGSRSPNLWKVAEQRP